MKFPLWWGYRYSLELHNFPKKSELLTFILPLKISWLIFFCSFRGGNEKFAEIRAGLLSCLAALPLNFALMATPALQREPPRKLNIPVDPRFYLLISFWFK